VSRELFKNDENNRYTFNISDITENYSYGSMQNHNTADALCEQGRVRIDSVKLHKDYSNCNLITFTVKIYDFDGTEHEVRIIKCKRPVKRRNNYEFKKTG